MKAVYWSAAVGRRFGFLASTPLAVVLLVAFPPSLLAVAKEKTTSSPKSAPKPITVPFDLLKTQHMVVQIKVNGKGPYRVIFDTGAPINLITNKVAKEAGVFPKNFIRPFFAPFGSMGQFKIKSLQVGHWRASGVLKIAKTPDLGKPEVGEPDVFVKAENMDTIVMDHPTVSLISKHLGPVEGIVGFSFFARYRTTIDYQAKVMTFVPTTFQPPDMMDNVMKLLTAAPSKKIVAPAGQWGFRVHKDAKDGKAGVTVKDVLPDSPAAKAGLRAGDRLLTLAGRWTDSVADCYLAASFVAPNTQARLRIVRAGKEMSLVVAVGSGI